MLSIARDDLETVQASLDQAASETSNDSLITALSDAVAALQTVLDLFPRTFMVTFYRVQQLQVEVEASDEYEAIEQAQDNADDADVVDDDYETMWESYDAFPPDVEEN